jgi:DNA processing protein
MDASTLRPGDGRYPAALARLPGAPASLRLRGSLGAARHRVAVVGSRDTDRYGRDTARGLARGLARAGVSVVSGGALGVDAAAHEGALEAGGHTVAVLGCGVDVAYPASHRELFERILAAGGGLLSEYEDGARAATWTFPDRNRIVAGMCDAVVVVRAGPRSGALITAAHARTFGVPVLAVPGDVDQELAEGPLALLRSGARLAASADDVLALLGLAPGAQPELPLAGLDPRARALLGALSRSPRHVDELARAAGVPAGAALAGLLALELDGLCEQRPGLEFLRRGA